MEAMTFSVASIIGLLAHYKYALLFPVLVVEGPVATIIASFLASPGGGYVLNVFAVFWVVCAADIVGDTMYYWLGRGGRRVFIPQAKLEYLKEQFRLHGVKFLVAGKFSHGLGWPVMVAAGSIHLPYKKFFSVNIVVSLVKSVILVALGYYYGAEFERLSSYLGKTGLIVTTALVLFVLYIFIFSRRKKMF